MGENGATGIVYTPTQKYAAFSGYSAYVIVDRGYYLTAGRTTSCQLEVTGIR